MSVSDPEACPGDEPLRRRSTFPSGLFNLRRVFSIPEYLEYQRRFTVPDLSDEKHISRVHSLYADDYSVYQPNSYFPTTQPEKKEPDEQYNIVCFGPNDPDNPKNWPKSRKWIVTIFVSIFAFIG